MNEQHVTTLGAPGHLIALLAHHGTKACDWTCQFSAGWNGKSVPATTSSAGVSGGILAWAFLIGLVVVIGAAVARRRSASSQSS